MSGYGGSQRGRGKKRWGERKGREEINLLRVANEVKKHATHASGVCLLLGESRPDELSVSAIGRSQS